MTAAAVMRAVRMTMATLIALVAGPLIVVLLCVLLKVMPIDQE